MKKPTLICHCGGAMIYCEVDLKEDLLEQLNILLPLSGFSLHDLEQMFLELP